MDNFSPCRETEQALPDYEVEPHPGPTADFIMIQRGDCLRPGRWHWRCRREDGAGNINYGYVEADPLGHAIRPETFEADH